MYVDLDHQIQIKGTVEEIYKALSTEAGIKSWWTRDIKMSPREGDLMLVGFNNHSIVFEMTILELTKPRRMLLETNRGTDEAWAGTMLEFELNESEKDGFVDVSFSHSGWEAASKTYPEWNTVWGHLMHNLKMVIENGKSNPVYK